MRAIISADLHFHAWREFATEIDGANSRLLWCSDAVQQMGNLAEERQCDALLIAGDIFQKKSYLYVPTLNMVASTFAAVAHQLPIYLLPGNHDAHDRDGQHALQVFTQIPRVRVLVDEVVEINGTRVAAHYCHGTADPYGFEADVFLGHGFVVGASLASGQVCDTGYSADRLAERYQWSFIGDIHQAQMFANDRVVIPGSPLAHDFGDLRSLKSVVYLDTETKTLETLPIHAPAFREVRWPEDAANADDYNYHRVICSEPVDSAAMAEIQRRWPHSRIMAPPKSNAAALRLVLAPTPDGTPARLEDATDAQLVRAYLDQYRADDLTEEERDWCAARCAEELAVHS